jgi:hypothetical protein
VDQSLVLALLLFLRCSLPLLLLLLQVEEGDNGGNAFSRAFDSLRDRVGGMIDKGAAAAAAAAAGGGAGGRNSNSGSEKQGGRSSSNGSEKQVGRSSRSPRWSLLSSKQDVAGMQLQQQQAQHELAKEAQEHAAADGVGAAVCGACDGLTLSGSSSFCTRVTRSTSSTTGYAVAEQPAVLLEATAEQLHSDTTEQHGLELSSSTVVALSGSWHGQAAAEHAAQQQ